MTKDGHREKITAKDPNMRNQHHQTSPDGSYTLFSLPLVLKSNVSSLQISFWGY